MQPGRADPVRRWRSAACAIGLTAAAAVSAAQPTRYLTGFATATAIIETSALRCIALDVFIADSNAQRSQGLMRIERLEEFEGMLFFFNPPALIAMWMKNTYIPLDMFFIRDDGSIAAIAERTTPMSTARIASPVPVSMVLELNAGFAASKSLRVGNRLLAVD